jgi:hypothetical protein
MDWTQCVSDIKMNAVGSFIEQIHHDVTTHTAFQSQNKPHGIEAVQSSQPRKRNGKMFGAGWHPSMEAGKTIVSYAPLRDETALNMYVTLISIILYQSYC